MKAHQQEIENLVEHMENDRNRQQDNLKRKLEEKRRQHMDALQRKHEREQARELLEQQKELKDVRANNVSTWKYIENRNVHCVVQGITCNAPQNRGRLTLKRTG